MREKGDDNAVVVDVEFDGLDSVVTVDAPEYLRAKLRYSCDVIGTKVSFKLLLRFDDAGAGKKDECGDDPSSDCKGFDEECENSCPDENRSARAEQKDGQGNFHPGENPKEADDFVKRETSADDADADADNKDECGDNPCPENRFGQDDRKVPCDETEASKSQNSGPNGASCNVDDENRSANTEQKDGQGNVHPGENPNEADDFVKRETSAEDADYKSFKHEESHDEPSSRFDWDYDDDQFDWSCSFDDHQDAVFLSDLDFSYCYGRHNNAEMKEEGVENSGEDECGNDASGCKDFKGSYGNQSGQEDVKVPRSSWSSEKGDNAKAADDCFKEETFVEDHKSSCDFKHEQSHDDAQDDVISERERMKETDGYKRADEAEWAARQQEIQNQAEEARILRKRRKLEMSEAEKKAQEAERQLKRQKAEELRATELQQRLKDRLQEFKAAERKEEADKNEKERYRVAARQYVSWLESKCKDLPSLLHALGIGGSKPSPAEVRKAYKKAVLKYHPDHSSQAAIPQQVHAEEMFKLIRKMNEKYFTHVKGRH